MREIAPGLWHWTAPRETIGKDVSSYYLVEERVVLDPMIPPERPEWFRPEHVPPSQPRRVGARLPAVGRGAGRARA